MGNLVDICSDQDPSLVSDPYQACILCGHRSGVLVLSDIDLGPDIEYQAFESMGKRGSNERDQLAEFGHGEILSLLAERLAVWCL